MSVAVVTDSTASLPRELAERLGITVVPLQVVIGAKTYDEGGDHAAGEIVSARLIAEAMREWTPVSTSRPNPEQFARVYHELADAGASEIVSVHLSGELSGTVESAQLAANRASVPVTVVDSRQAGIAIGFAVLAAANAAADGAGAGDAGRIARQHALRTSTLLYVDTLEYLRRGGRVGAVASVLGSALSVKPILAVEDGRVVPRDRVRTSGKALARLEDLAVDSAGESARVDVGVAHLANPDRANQLAAGLTQRLGERAAGQLDDRPVWVGEVGAVLGAHVGPGMVAVCVARH